MTKWCLHFLSNLRHFKEGAIIHFPLLQIFIAPAYYSQNGRFSLLALYLVQHTNMAVEVFLFALCFLKISLQPGSFMANKTRLSHLNKERKFGCCFMNISTLIVVGNNEMCMQFSHLNSFLVERTFFN